jgi:hypothetical protein
VLINVLKSASADGHEPQPVHPKCSTSTVRVAAHDEDAIKTNPTSNAFLTIAAPFVERIYTQNDLFTAFIRQ